MTGTETLRSWAIPAALIATLSLALFRGPLTFVIGNYATVVVALPLLAIWLLFDWKRVISCLSRPEVIAAIAFLVWAAIKIPFSTSIFRGVLGFGHIGLPIFAFLVFLGLLQSAPQTPDWLLRLAVILTSILIAGFGIEVYFNVPLSNLLQHTTPPDIASVFAPFRTGSFIGASLPFGVVIGMLLPFVVTIAIRRPNLVNVLILAAFLPMVLATYGRGAMLQSCAATIAVSGLLLANRWTTSKHDRRYFPSVAGWRGVGIAIAILAILPFVYSAVPSSISSRLESGLISVCKVARLGSICTSNVSPSVAAAPVTPAQSTEKTCDTVLSVTERRGDEVNRDALYQRCIESADAGLDVSSIARFEVYNAIFAYQDTLAKKLFGGSLMASGNFVKYFGFDYLIPGVEASESYYLKLYSELGLVGIVLFMSLFLFVIIRCALTSILRPKTDMTLVSIAAAASLVAIGAEMAFLQSLENPVVAIVFGWVMAVGTYSVWKQQRT